MRCPIEVRCLVCRLIFCCADCRWNHEKNVHNLKFDCPICRQNSFLCAPNKLEPSLIKHLFDVHLPLKCNKCDKQFSNMEDLMSVNQCNSISELVEPEKETKDVDDKFDAILAKVDSNNDAEDFEAIISVNKAGKTAVITPIIRKKYLVDYESSENEEEDVKENIATPHVKLVSKTPKSKRQRVATPHVKKFLSLFKQAAVDENDDITNAINVEPSSTVPKTTPSRMEVEAVPDSACEMTTPTSHLPHITKLTQVVSTSTPTHPATSGWSLFTEQDADSPLSEIENTENSGQVLSEQSKTESESVAPKLKGIISVGSKIRLGSQDSSEKQVTFQESENTESSSTKIKKVKFADNTIFEPESKIKRVYRKPKRMLTPGPQKPKYSCNPRFQALINRFENPSRLTMARTPTNNKPKAAEITPSIGDTHMPARAINFKEDSPLVGENYSKESNELFKTCVASPAEPLNKAITALSTNIAGTLQNCLADVLKTTEEETEIQFKFIITKKRVSVKRIVENTDAVAESTAQIEANVETNKENFWSSVANVVKNVFRSKDNQSSGSATPYASCDSSTNSSSASKRKCEDMSDSELSPLNHKRYKYEGRIRGRPPLRRSKTWVSSLRSTQSEQSVLKTSNQDDALNQSL